MKNIFVIVALSFSFLFANAQFEAGKIQVAGSSGLNFSGSKNTNKYDGKTVGDDTKTTSFEFSPKIGYFILDNIAVGARLGFQYEKTKEGDVTNKQFIRNFGPYVRYYLPQGKIAPFANVEMGLASSKSEISSNMFDSEVKSNGFFFSLGGGVAYLITENIAVDALLGYSYARFKNKDDNKQKIITSGFGLEVGLSLQF